MQTQERPEATMKEVKITQAHLMSPAPAKRTRWNLISQMKRWMQTEWASIHLTISSCLTLCSTTPNLTLCHIATCRTWTNLGQSKTTFQPLTNKLKQKDRTMVTSILTSRLWRTLSQKTTPSLYLPTNQINKVASRKWLSMFSWSLSSSHRRPSTLFLTMLSRPPTSWVPPKRSSSSPNNRCNNPALARSETFRWVNLCLVLSY